MKIKRAYFSDGVKNAADELAGEVINFTKETGAKGGVVGLSGGIDSTTVAYLCKYAFDRDASGLQLCGVIMPSRANHGSDEKDGLRVAKNLGIESIIVSIEPIANAIISQTHGIIENYFDKGNLYSESRAIVLSRIAAAKNYRVMGTGNRDEDYVLGYFTKRGDGAVDNNVLGDLPKRLVRDLARYLGVPEDLVNRIPTAGLWQGQTDEGELGYTYEQAEIIQNGFDQGYTSIQIQKITGFKKEIIDDVSKRHRITEHKRNSPPVGKVNLSYGEYNEI
ncbi:MAG: NAD(+) synthase [Nanoarchaeota archaeon]|nr:NAD(+) synthase [Nanoarchaeota archaeon]